eukprot:CAMPEP_0113849068 /NCGR_PEP_ID=MMETSP0372-20130328/2878_1 /TAXON_ID=340204 /ORGANISM="Lankesteria abbotti" /LENGTH=96 /DNA_ID=CAMNT_0000818723 /DNA_START=374 /DNA_END=664 /DNA_ORIENTATION=+ /assembly_acc=CAM_ASM_000359
MFDELDEDFKGGDKGCDESEDWWKGLVTHVNVVGDSGSYISYYFTKQINVRLTHHDIHTAEKKVMRFCTKNGLKAAEEFISAASSVSLQHVGVPGE